MWRSYSLRLMTMTIPWALKHALLLYRVAFSLLLRAAIPLFMVTIIIIIGLCVCAIIWSFSARFITLLYTDSSPAAAIKPEQRANQIRVVGSGVSLPTQHKTREVHAKSHYYQVWSFPIFGSNLAHPFNSRGKARAKTSQSFSFQPRACDTHSRTGISQWLVILRTGIL